MLLLCQVQCTEATDIPVTGVRPILEEKLHHLHNTHSQNLVRERNLQQLVDLDIVQNNYVKPKSASSKADAQQPIHYKIQQVINMTKHFGSGPQLMLQLATIKSCSKSLKSFFLFQLIQRMPVPDTTHCIHVMLNVLECVFIIKLEGVPTKLATHCRYQPYPIQHMHHANCGTFLQCINIS